VKNHRPIKPKSLKRIALERNIELLIFWANSVTWMAFGLIFTVVYFKAGVTHNEIMSAIRYQIVAFSVAAFSCPLVPAPFWLRCIMFVGGIIAIDLGFGS
jgi:hypothetical protein